MYHIIIVEIADRHFNNLMRKEENTMALTKCPHCGKEISVKAKTCPNCGAPVRKIQKRKQSNKFFLIGGAVIIVFLILGLASGELKPQKTSGTSNSNTDSDIETTAVGATTDVSEVVDSSEFSRITSSELIDRLGEPVTIEDWTNKTSKGDFLVKTYSYDIDDNHYEFIVAEDSVVRLSIYSGKNWNGAGEDFSYSGDKSDIFEMFGITPDSDMKVKADTGYAYRISDVNSKVAAFDIYDLTDSNTFATVKITYNLNYFDE